MEFRGLELQFCFITLALKLRNERKCKRERKREKITRREKSKKSISHFCCQNWLPKSFFYQKCRKSCQMRHNFSQLPFSHITIKQDRSTKQEKFIWRKLNSFCVWVPIKYHFHFVDPLILNGKFKVSYFLIHCHSFRTNITPLWN